MSCSSLNSGYALACRGDNSVGGIKWIAFTELTNKQSISTDANDIITGFTLSSSTNFYRFETKDTSTDNEVLTVDYVNGSTVAQQTLTLVLNRKDSTKRNQIKLLAQNPLMAIVYTNTGDYILYGETRGVELQTSNATSGTLMTDRSGYEITFVGSEPTEARYVSSSLISSLVTI